MPKFQPEGETSPDYNNHSRSEVTANSLTSTGQPGTHEGFEYLTDEARAVLKDYPDLAAAADRMLGEFQLYLTQRYTFIHCGQKKKGQAESTASNHRTSLDRLLRHHWSEGRLGIVLTPDDADRLNDAMRWDDITRYDGRKYSLGTKRKLQDALELYFRWLIEEYNGVEWEPDHIFKSRAKNPADSFSKKELQSLRDVMLENDDGPSYKHVSPAERRRFQGLIANQIGRPVDEITPSDWTHIDSSWELPALICTSADIGPRPTDVRCLQVQDLRLDDCVVYVPELQGEYKREGDRHRVAIREDTAQILRGWLEERRCYDRYQDTPLVFTNERGNPLTSGPLNNRLRKVMMEANIDTSNRKLVWTSLRHTIGTLMSEVADIEHVRKQLRHKSPETTRKYLGSSPERRQKALDAMSTDSATKTLHSLPGLDSLPPQTIQTLHQMVAQAPRHE